MKHVFDILAEFANRYPTLQWPTVFAICAVIILTWKLIEQLSPKAIIFLVNQLRQAFSSRKIHLEQEVLVRSFTEKTQVLKWLSYVKSLSRYHLTATIDDIYFPLSYAMVNGKHQHASTTIERILYDNEKFAIVGPPGSGKSTVLSKIAIAYASDTVEETFGVKESRLPLFLNLKGLPQHLDPLPKILTDALRNAGCDLQESFLLDQLKHRRCVVLLDGLDETGDDVRRRQVVDWITESMAAFPENRFVVTCRNVEWDLVNVPAMPYANVLSLMTNEIEGIIAQWDRCFSANRGILPPGGRREIEGLSDALSKAENRNLMQLAKNPLLLTIMIVLKLHGVNIPIRKVEVYNVFVRTLLGEWEEVKNLAPDVTGIRLRKRLKLFQRLSLFILENPALKEVIDLRDGELTSFMTRQISNVFQEDIGITEFLDAIAMRTGLLYKSGDDLYLFSNRGFLEFLSAKELADNLEYDKVFQYIHHENWHEIIIQFMSLLTDATPLIKRIVDDGNRPYDIPHSLLAKALLEAISVDTTVRRKSVELINTHLLDNLMTGKIDSELIKDAYALDPDFWLELPRQVLLKNSDISIKPSVVCEVLSSLDDAMSLDCLEEIANELGSEIERDVAQSLRLSASTKAVDMLWSFAGNPGLRDVVIDSLLSKGDSVISSCEKVLSNPSSTLSAKATAASVLCRINNPVVLKTLGHFMKLASPSLHDHIISELHETYLSGYKLKETEKAIEMMKDIFSPTFYARSVKKYFDVLLAAVVLLLVWWPLLFASFLIKLDSPGPVLYRQRRIGMRGKEFNLYKLRTMRLGTEKMGGHIWAMQADPRVTRVGKILRMTRIDELPQLVNVLRGEMSFVGPRPERPEFVEVLQKHVPHLLLRYGVKPGLTGLAQVSYVYGSTMEDVRQKLVFDLYYISNCRFRLDLFILARTVRMAVMAQGAR